MLSSAFNLLPVTISNEEQEELYVFENANGTNINPNYENKIIIHGNVDAICNDVSCNDVICFDATCNDNTLDSCNDDANGNDNTSVQISNNDLTYVKNSDIKLLVWNIQGLGNKFECHNLLKQVSDYDIIFFLETMKLDNYCPNTGGYVFKHFQRKYQNPRARKPSGGIGILIKSKYVDDNTISIVKSTDFIVWLKIKQINQDDLFIGAVYIPPLDSSSMTSNFKDNNAFDLIQQDVVQFMQIGNVALCGDFNARTGTLPDYDKTQGKDADFNIFSNPTEFPQIDRFSEDTKINTYGRELIALCKLSQLRIMNGYFENP